MIQTLNLPRRPSEKAKVPSDAVAASEMVTTPAESLVAPSKNEDHSEGVVARTIEQETAKMPSDLFLWAALGTMGLSVALYATKKKSTSLLIGQLAAPILIMGVYNKLVKLAGSDRVENDPNYTRRY